MDIYFFILFYFIIVMIYDEDEQHIVATICWKIVFLPLFLIFLIFLDVGILYACRSYPYWG